MHAADFRPLIATLAGLALATAAHAQVTRYDINKNAFFNQTTDGLVDLPEYTHGIYAYLETTYHEDAGTCVVTGPGTQTPAVLDVNQFGNWSGFLGYHDTDAFTEAAFPPGTYTFSISAGDLGARSASFVQIAPAYPLSIPYITGDGFSRIQNMDPSQPFTFTLNGMVQNPATNLTQVGVTIQDVCGTSFPWSVTDPDSDTITIPAGTLAPAHQYVFLMSYSNALQTPNAGFSDSADSYCHFANVTQFVFFCGYDGCLADITGDKVVDLEDFFAFFNCFDVGGSCADLNGCGDVDLDDFFVFFNAWDGSCPG